MSDQESQECAGLTAIVTGGASGIGLATAMLPAERGAGTDLAVDGGMHGLRLPARRD